MKILILNGSPHPKGETYKALCIVEDAIKTEGVDTKWLWIGNKPVRGCIDCNKCAKTGRCIFNDDPCNDIIDAILECDGVVIGTPVYFSNPNGALCAVLDRVFYAGETHAHLFGGKIGASVASLMYSGGNNAVDRIAKYFAFSQMPIISGNYWNLMFESKSKMAPDGKGRETLHTLGKNIAKYLKNKQ